MLPGSMSWPARQRQFTRNLRLELKHAIGLTKPIDRKHHRKQREEGNNQEVLTACLGQSEAVRQRHTPVQLQVLHLETVAATSAYTDGPWVTRNDCMQEFVFSG